MCKNGNGKVEIRIRIMITQKAVDKAVGFESGYKGNEYHSIYYRDKIKYEMCA